jgi:hypothetical protein
VASPCLRCLHVATIFVPPMKHLGLSTYHPNSHSAPALSPCLPNSFSCSCNTALNLNSAPALSPCLPSRCPAACHNPLYFSVSGAGDPILVHDPEASDLTNSPENVLRNYGLNHGGVDTVFGRMSSTDLTKALQCPRPNATCSPPAIPAGGGGRPWRLFQCPVPGARHSGCFIARCFFAAHSFLTGPIQGPGYIRAARIYGRALGLPQRPNSSSRPVCETT